MKKGVPSPDYEGEVIEGPDGDDDADEIPPDMLSDRVCEDNRNEETGVAYWWLNSNPKIWDMSKSQVGERQTYTSHNSKGNKRRIFQYLLRSSPGICFSATLHHPSVSL